jgi:tetratricopeptide (TPR) repeat protein
MISDRSSGSPLSAVASAKADSSAVALAKAERRHRRGAWTRLRLPFAVAVVAFAAFAAHGIEQRELRLSARTALAEGEEAFRHGDFVRAADRFRSALTIDPASTSVRLRLVAAYQGQYVPGGESLANHDVAKQALEEIARVLDRDASNTAAIVAAAEINDARSDNDQARDWYGRLAAIDSSNAAAFAGMSAASLRQASAAVLDAASRAGLLLSSGHPIANDDLRRSLAERWSATIAEGIDAASKAVTIDRQHEGAMLTLEAWHQLAADLAASPDEYRRHMISANEWRHKVLDARRLKTQRGAQ